MPTLILPYKAGSNSANALASGIGCRKMKLNSTRRDEANLTIVNWGNTRTDLSRFTQATVLNRNTRVASNKREFFGRIQEWNSDESRTPISVPDFTTEKSVAESWLADNKAVVCRTVLAGHSGEGIVLVEPVEGATIPDAPLYTKYTKKRDEYRVHVIGGVVVDVQQKRRNTTTPDDVVNWKVRNHSNGFIYARENVHPHQSVLDNAVRTVSALGLDFAAVDIIWNNHYQKAYVLEANTACGIEGTTLESYVNGLSSLILGSTPSAWVAEPQEVDTLPEVVDPFEGKTVGCLVRGVEGRGASPDFVGRVLVLDRRNESLVVCDVLNPSFFFTTPSIAVEPAAEAPSSDPRGERFQQTLRDIASGRDYVEIRVLSGSSVRRRFTGNNVSLRGDDLSFFRYNGYDRVRVQILNEVSVNV